MSSDGSLNDAKNGISDLLDYCTNHSLAVPFYHISADIRKSPVRYYVKCCVGEVSSPVYYYNGKTRVVRKAAAFVLKKLKESAPGATSEK